jgi:transposase
VQVAVDTEHHLIVAHDVINIGNDRGQLARMSKAAKETLQAQALEVVADRGYFDGNEILACAEANITVTLPKPMTSGAKAGTVWQAGLCLSKTPIAARPERG